jgi:hypothetical protein
MKVTRLRGVGIGLLIASGSLLVLAASCSFDKPGDTAGADDKTAEPTPVVEQAKSKPNPGFVANQFCYACHANFQGETLEAGHAKAGIGCERCHGESDRHRSDEANITPPELMYPRAKINPTCMMCHPRDSIKDVDSHKVILAGAATVLDEEKPDAPLTVCTDCHAKNHKMNVRITRWDKATGEILKE